MVESNSGIYNRGSVRFQKLVTFMDSFSEAKLLLPVYWYALNFEDHRQWSAREGNGSRSIQKDELEK